MRRTLRTFMVCMLVVVMTFNPASAWHIFGGGGGHGGYAGYGGGYAGCSSYRGGYSGCYSGPGYCGSYGYASYGYGGSCGSGYGDCSSCGGGCGGDYYSSGGYAEYDSCGGCSSCGGEVVVDHGVSGYSHEMAPSMPMDGVPSTTTPSMPSPQEPTNVTRPSETTTTPELPPEPAPDTTQPIPPAEDTTTPADDLFGPPAETIPPAETTPPATPPAETNDMEDLFGTTPADTTPTDAPATPPADTTPSEPAGDDLFGPPPATEGTFTPPAGDTGFPAETTPPADAAPAEGETTEDASDIFGSSRGILREPGGLASADLREWIDNTGKYSCQGRLVRVLDSKVQLLKDNGRTTTVPLRRLSALDLEFVHRQASAQSEMVDQLVQTMAIMSLAAN